MHPFSTPENIKNLVNLSIPFENVRKYLLLRGCRMGTLASNGLSYDCDFSAQFLTT